MEHAAEVDAPEEVVPGVARAMRAQATDKAILIRSRHSNPNLVFRPIKRFPAAIRDDEIFFIYEVRTLQPTEKIYLAIANHKLYLTI